MLAVALVPKVLAGRLASHLATSAAGVVHFFFLLRKVKGAPAASPRLPQAPPMAIFNVANVNVQR